MYDRVSAWRAAASVVATATAGVLIAGLVTGQAAAQPAPLLSTSTTVGSAADIAAPVPSAVGDRKPARLPAMPATPQRSKPVWPKAGTATVSVSDSDRRAGTLPVTLAHPAPQGRASTDAAPERAGAQRVEVEMLPRAKAEQAGLRGVLFALREAGEGDRTSQAAAVRAARVPGRVAVTVDYTGFRSAYGGGFASRLGLVRYPVCILDRPRDTECAKGTPVASRNDLKAGQVTSSDVEVAPPGAPTAERTAFVYALEASASGSSGSYKATDLLNSADWSVSGNSGAFTYAYPLSAPPAPGGDPLNLALHYNSQSVDGRTSAQNAQPSWVGQGWDIAPGFIERRYHSCTSDGQSSADLCWKDYDQVAISLGGRSTQLIPLDAGRTKWRLRDDPGWSVDLPGDGHQQR
ncbi:hypothetical protein STANM309S_00223 [Streptomyces tanashiensis]